ncbi:hypothetical protein SODG_002743 [Sodalis praecaptivus]
MSEKPVETMSLAESMSLNSAVNISKMVVMWERLKPVALVLRQKHVRNKS